MGFGAWLRLPLSLPDSQQVWSAPGARRLAAQLLWQAGLCVEDVGDVGGGQAPMLQTENNTQGRREQLLHT